MSESTEPTGESEKGCTGCDRTLPVSHFNIDRSKPSGLCYWCKGCKSEYYQEKLARKAGAPCDELRGDPDPVEEPAKRPRLEPEDLYIMALSTDPNGAVHGLKVGRAGNIQQRANTLSESMQFNISVLATFPGAGHLEKTVHTRLEKQETPQAVAESGSTQLFPMSCTR